MLHLLSGSKAIEQILFFLFVNGKCYGTQLHRLLQRPLTPLQKGLSRLEKGGVIRSGFEGKTKIYTFNPSFPLLAELQQLLKKSYSLLPLSEKTIYYAGKESLFLERDETIKKRVILEQTWTLLSKIQSLHFRAQTKSMEETGWEGEGKAHVERVKEGTDTLIFTEQGNFKGKEGKETRFTNTLRWTWDRQAHLLSLAHLRREHPVFLVHFSPVSKSSLSSVDSMICAKDTYFAKLHFDSQQIRLSWRVIGPKKDEEIDCYYSIYPHS